MKLLALPEKFETPHVVSYREIIRKIIVGNDVRSF